MTLNLAGRTVHVVDAAVWDSDGNEVGRRSYAYQNPMTDKSRMHHEICEWHLDQYPWECTCGLTAPKAPWFDKAVSEFEGRSACMTDIVERLRDRECKFCDEAADEIERLQRGIRDYLNGDYEPKVSNVDKCPHGFYGYEVCEHCTDDHFRKLLGVKT